MDLIYWSVHYPLGRDGIKKVDRYLGGIVILPSWEHHFIRVLENLVQHPSNNMSIPFSKPYLLEKF